MAINRYTIKEKEQLRRQCGSWLKYQREQIKRPENKNKVMTQRNVADALGNVTDSYISIIEKGIPALPEERWGEYADVIEVPRNEFARRMLFWLKPDIYDDLFGDREEYEKIYHEELRERA